MDLTNLISGLIGALVGAAIGALAVIWSTRQTIQVSWKQLTEQQRWAEEARKGEHQQVRSAVRHLLEAELDYNLQALRTYWRDYVEPHVAGTSEEYQFVQRLRFTSKPLPKWEHQRWQSLTVELTQSLTADELQNLQTIHTRLASLTDLRERFVPLLPTKLADGYVAFRKSTPAQQKNLPADLFQVIREYLSESGTVWQECWDLWRSLDGSPPFNP